MRNGTILFHTNTPNPKPRPSRGRTEVERLDYLSARDKQGLADVVVVRGLYIHIQTHRMHACIQTAIYKYVHLLSISLVSCLPRWPAASCPHPPAPSTCFPTYLPTYLSTDRFSYLRTWISTSVLTHDLSGLFITTIIYYIYI